MRKRKRIIWISLIIIIVGIGLWLFKFSGHHATFQAEHVPDNFWGVTFSKKYAEELGLDWRDAYSAMVTDLGVRNIRLPVYWDDVEKVQDVYDFSDYDWMLEEGTRQDVRFILNVGRRLPRWPECHEPTWVTVLSEEQVDVRHVTAVKAAIDHFKEYKAIQYWQLENEYFFPWFGLCPKANPDILEEEIEYLRSRDTRSIILTDSGELNSWREAAERADLLGVTMYRVVWSKYFGYTRYPWPAALYRSKALFAGKSPDTMIIAELQAEPWPSKFQGVRDISRAEADKSFSLKQFETNSEIARRTGFRQAYFWGAEWWYWLKTQGDARMWNKAKEIIRTNNAVK